MFQSRLFFKEITRIHTDGRKIISTLEMLKEHGLSDPEKKRKRGLIYQRLLDILKVFQWGKCRVTAKTGSNVKPLGKHGLWTGIQWTTKFSVLPLASGKQAGSHKTRSQARIGKLLFKKQMTLMVNAQWAKGIKILKNHPLVEINT